MKAARVCAQLTPSAQLVLKLNSLAFPTRCMPPVGAFHETVHSTCFRWRIDRSGLMRSKHARVAAADVAELLRRLLETLPDLVLAHVGLWT